MSSTIFNGTSRYSQDFQQVIQRAVAIASLPLTQLNQQRAKLTDKQTALNELQTRFTAISTALEGLSSGVTSGSVSADVTDSAVARATITGASLPGVYQLEVTALGSYTRTLSGAGLPVISDPSTQGLSASTSLTLTVDGENYTIEPADSSLNALVTALNASDASISANIVNLGTAGAPDYRLAVQSSNLAASTIQLSDGSGNLLNTIATGTPAAYTVNGQPEGGISSSSRTIALSPGLTVDLRGLGATEISLQQTPSLLAESVTTFVNAFNAAIDELDKHHGKAGGALTGDSSVTEMSKVLSTIGNYGSGDPDSLTLDAIGLSFDSTGHLRVDSSVLASMSQSQFRKVTAFLSGVHSGGFLKAASDAFDTLTNGTTGLLHSNLDSVASSIRTSDRLIAANEERIADLQSSLEQRMAAADALIASLEQKVSYFDALFSSMESIGKQ